MIQTKIVEKGGRYEVQSLDGRRVYGTYKEPGRAAMRQRHILNSSKPRREKGLKTGQAKAG